MLYPILLILGFIPASIMKSPSYKCVPSDDCPDKIFPNIPKCNSTHLWCSVFPSQIQKSPSEEACKKFSRDENVCPTVSLVGGEIEARTQEFSHVVAVGVNTTNGIIYRCMGTLIHQQWVLTAAHCTDLEPALEVRLGAFNKSHPNEGVVFKVIDTILHPDYKRHWIGSLTNDLALLKLEIPTRFTKFIKPACLSTNNGIDEKTFFASVRGHTENGDPQSLKGLLLSQLPMVNCSDVLPGNNTLQICTGLPDANLRGGICPGDAGGPLELRHNAFGNCLTQVYGVVSYGDDCIGELSRTKSTRVFAYLDWIESIVPFKDPTQRI